jgi:hypothetical protein
MKNPDRPLLRVAFYRHLCVQGGFLKKLTRYGAEMTSDQNQPAWFPESILTMVASAYIKDYIWIAFETNSRLIRLESSVFSTSSLQSIIIPSSVEILESECFQTCNLLSTIIFELNSRLTRIGSEAFSYSSLPSIVILSSVKILESKCFH